MNELDEFLAELRDRTDEISGSVLRLPNGQEVWLYTETQVKAWLDEATTAWKAGNYISPEEPSK